MMSSSTTAQKKNKSISDAVEELYLRICKEIAEIDVIEETRVGNKLSNSRNFYRFFKALITLTRNDQNMIKRSNGLIERVDNWFKLKKSLSKLDEGINLAMEYNKLLFDSGLLTLGSSIRSK